MTRRDRERERVSRHDKEGQRERGGGQGKDLREGQKEKGEKRMSGQDKEGQREGAGEGGAEQGLEGGTEKERWGGQDTDLKER